MILAKRFEARLSSFSRPRLSNILSMSPAERTYISIFEWPPDLHDEARAAALVDALSIHPADAMRIARRPAPLVLSLLPPNTPADAILRPLADHHIRAIAVSAAQLHALPDPTPAKRLALHSGPHGPLIGAEAWRGDSAGGLARNLFLLVRARILNSAARRMIRDTRAHSRHAPAPRQDYLSPKSTSISDLADLYFSDGSRIRVNADKFNFDILESSKGFSDNENLDKLTLLIASHAPNLLVDAAFADFTPPPDLAASSFYTPNMTVAARSDAPLFDFYSPWLFLLYKHRFAG